jgi:hypothetical protein
VHKDRTATAFARLVLSTGDALHKESETCR